MALGDNTKFYETPNHPYQGERINEEHGLVGRYGLKNKQELWSEQSQLRNFRREARRLLGRTDSDGERVSDAAVPESLHGEGDDHDTECEYHDGRLHEPGQRGGTCADDGEQSGGVNPGRAVGEQSVGRSRHGIRRIIVAGFPVDRTPSCGRPAKSYNPPFQCNTPLASSTLSTVSRDRRFPRADTTTTTPSTRAATAKRT